MIDLRILRDDPEGAREAQRRRGASPELIDEILSADEARRTSITSFEQLRSEQKSLGRQVARASGDEKEQLLQHGRELALRVKRAETAQAGAEADYDSVMRQLANLASIEAPAGGEDDYVVLEKIGAPRDFAAEGFAPLDHVELGKRLQAFDIERGAKVSGARFYYLTGVGAMLELALLQMAMERASAAGFTPMIPPALVKPRAMEGTGFLGQAAADVYALPDDDFYLVGTSEVPLAAYHSDEILDGSSLPRRYAAFSPCYRKEAGSYGKDTRGIFRVHWFDKVELFTYTTVEESYAEHERLLQWEKNWLIELGLPFRVIDVAAGDLGLSAVRKFDCEAWIPTQGRYRELTSASNCTDFQARRLAVRGRFDDGVKPLATLNGTACAMTRTILALLENHQQADGTVAVPEALQPYLHGRKTLDPVE
ncbi:MAG: serine--tRNA ligase [Propionibacteriales bacterium]|nr:serine--tRNA ligase [Propionibacteriales bacterium]